jgi:hypothetical protein
MMRRGDETRRLLKMPMFPIGNPRRGRHVEPAPTPEPATSAGPTRLQHYCMDVQTLYGRWKVGGLG